MNRTALVALLTFFLTISSLAQQAPGAGTTGVESSSAVTSEVRNVTVKGKVIEKDTGQPLEYATVSFFSKRSNKIITGGITNLEGEFSIRVAQGVYDVRIEFIGFKTITLADRDIQRNENIGTFGMEIDSESLDEVLVIAEKTTVEIKLDKKIYNVGRDLTVRGGTVSDVLDNVPSVSVDVEGNVALRGNDDVRILINGKPSGLVGLNSTDALRQLPAEAIERVEVITSPSARYDAEGSAGILNIILRRSKLQGLNGAVTLNGGYPETYGASGNINFRYGDLNIFNTLNYNDRNVPGNSFSDTEFFNGDDPSTFLREDREFDRSRQSFSTNTGVEWYVNETSSITAAFVYRDSDNQSNTTNLLDELDASGGLINRTTRLDPEFEDDKTIQYSVNYDKQFGGDSQHRLTADFQFEDSEETEESLINQNGIDVEDVTTIEDQERILLQAEYVKPLGENGQFELGYRGTFESLDTDYAVLFSDDGIDFDLNTDLSNNLLFSQDVNAFYTQYGNKLGNKFSFLLGIRMEDTRITIDQVTSGDFEKKNYTQLFPTLNLGIEISEDESITFGYNRRIRRPRSRFINPFPSRSSATNLFQGNPDLDPSLSNAFDLGYLRKLGKLTLNGSVYYQEATDVFTFISIDSGETVLVGGTEVPVIIRTPVNLATNKRYGGEITATFRPNRKFNINANLNLFQSVLRGDFEGQNFDAENFTWFARLNAKYTLPGEIDWQTRLFYRGPRETAQSRSQGVFSTSLAFSKDLFEDKASIAFRVSDLFNSRKRITETFTPSFDSESEFQWRVRTFNLSFTYRFNQKKQRQRGDGNGDSDIEFEGQG
ncbi:MAG: TonB-dependent receptor [Flavobacteriaceae bacterium]|nr:TonB-dependent receptor [Flavobacteriaceae bacterium]